MNQLQTQTIATKSVARISRNSKIFKVIINAIQELKGENTISLDLRKIPEAIADFFIVCEATTNTQVKAIGDAVQNAVRDEVGESPYKTEGYQQAKWVLIDFVTVVVHVMQPETRKYYTLEDMWSDAPLVQHEDIELKAPSK